MKVFRNIAWIIAQESKLFFLWFKGYFPKLIDAHAKLLNEFMDWHVWACAFILTPTLAFISQYFFNDWDFLKWLCLMMLLDLITGIAKALINKKLVLSEGVRQSVTKGIQYFFFLIMVHVLISFQKSSNLLETFGWLRDTAYTLLMSIEGKSVLENLQEMRSSFDLQDLISRILPGGKKDDARDSGKQ